MKRYQVANIGRLFFRTSDELHRRTYRQVLYKHEKFFLFHSHRRCDMTEMIILSDKFGFGYIACLTRDIRTDFRELEF